MNAEKNSTSSVDREENERLVLEKVQPKKITRNSNPPIKVTPFWPRYESEMVIGTGHYAWASCRTQEAGKTTNALA